MKPTLATLPSTIDSEDQLDEVLSQPSPALVEFVRTLAGPVLILGAGGKMGPTLARLLRRAAEGSGHPLEIVAVSRFSDSTLCDRLRRLGIGAITCDLLDSQAVQRLPDASNILYLVGMKFGTKEKPSATWAINTIVPTRVAERYPNSRIVALSTGNVYPLGPVELGGSREPDVVTPLGEYCNAAVGRERVFEYHSRLRGTPIALIRLFYAIELRYGILVDIGRKIFEKRPVELANGYFNCIWQGDANEMIIRALTLTLSPPSCWNLCRPEVVSVREVADQFGELFGHAPHFVGQEASHCLLGNPAALCARLGAPSVTVKTMVNWIADWLRRGGRDLGKPTHFETRDGQY